MRLNFSPKNLAIASAIFFAVGLALFAAAVWLVVSDAMVIAVLACWLVSFTVGVVAGFKGRRWAFIFPVAAVLVIGYRPYKRYEGVVWINIAAYAHSQRGAVNCGRVEENPGYGVQPEADEAIQCALSACNEHRPFVVMFSVHGIDVQVSNAVVGDSDGNAVEILYATGMFEHAHKIMSHRCGSLQVEPPHPYKIPRLHCADWRTANYQRDYLLW